ncbi:MAG TPA: 3-oxoacyl-[acyl-carrier-protein] synthase III C-terminal domain-containing protein [Candidatus Kapabacteria bacterium]|nr:3-oxoacyl-[acyl-carrier-protein] synthase III C-terminal domain-containing protein [Candidatus Kapabacteria bacterium]
MPYIAGLTTATPPNVLEQQDAKRFAEQLFGGEIKHLLPVFDNALIDRRHFATEIDWFFQPHTFTEANDRYIESSLALAEEVVVKLTEQCGIGTQAFDAIFFVSTTGLSTPSIDARLFNKIPLNPHIKRIPVWGLGCAAGVAAIARASEYVRAFPKHRALVVSVELCSLAYQLGDRSKSNIVAAALFADGAAACLVAGDEVPHPSHGFAQPSIVGSLSTTYPNSLDVMGWRITSEGFKIVLSRDIPSIVTGLVRENIGELLNAHGLTVADIAHYLTHPGGAKVLEAYAQALALTHGELQPSLDVLRNFGNMSSATVFFIMERVLRETRANTGEYGLASALGPGFSSELVLLRWE